MSRLTDPLLCSAQSNARQDGLELWRWHLDQLGDHSIDYLPLVPGEASALPLRLGRFQNVDDLHLQSGRQRLQRGEWRYSLEVGAHGYVRLDLRQALPQRIEA